jgi:RNA polymerase sigma-70 factor (ECF subfamily)
MTEALEDTALMLRYRDGDAAAFETLYRRHRDSLYRYLLRLSANSHTAEDVFQEAWGKIIRARASYRPTAKFTTYLFRVAHNCFIDHIRRSKRHSGHSDAIPELAADPVDEPEHRTEQLLARQRLETALQTLPDEQRDAFLLHEEGGMSLDDIALITGVNRETAKSRLRYANTKLRAAMHDPAIDED